MTRFRSSLPAGLAAVLRSPASRQILRPVLILVLLTAPPLLSQAHGDQPSRALRPIIALRLTPHTGHAGTAQTVTGSVRFHDPDAGGTFPIDNGTSVLQRRLPGGARWTKVQSVSGADAGAPVFDRVHRLTRTLRYRLCYRGGGVVTYDASGHEVDLPLAAGCGSPVQVRVTS
jgi:hypothetical protein